VGDATAKLTSAPRPAESGGRGCVSGFLSPMDRHLERLGRIGSSMFRCPSVACLLRASGIGVSRGGVCQVD
jgi:hypothetical protein